MTTNFECVTSLYNFRVPIGEDVLLYNSNTGAVLRFSSRDAQILAETLTSGRIEIPEDSLPDEVYSQLWTGGFIIHSEKDELVEIRERFYKAREETPIVLTLTTTMDCNLGCYYCYEERSKSKLQVQDLAAIVALAEKRLTASGKRSLHVDWYGGEPFLNLEFIESASMALQDLCQRMNVAYSASVISNGTLWPEQSVDFVRKNKIRQVQISFDGMRENHDRHRRYRKDYKPGENASSFDRAVELIDQLLDGVRVDIRINIDQANQGDVIPFIKFARSRGWFNRNYPAVIQPARLASYSEQSAFMRKVELSVDEYDQIRAQVRDEVRSETLVEESESPDGFPYPKTSVCAALARDSVVIGADKQLYRCGLQVSESHRAVGQLDGEPREKLTNQGADERWWTEFDPTILPKCSRCSFLPICWGGCPKKHLEADEHAIAEQSYFWRKNLPRLIASGVGVEPPPDFTFTEADQFRLN
jgi:uncharacterized protein